MSRNYKCFINGEPWGSRETLDEAKRLLDKNGGKIYNPSSGEKWLKLWHWDRWKRVTDYKLIDRNGNIVIVEAHSFRDLYGEMHIFEYYTPCLGKIKRIINLRNGKCYYPDQIENLMRRETNFYKKVATVK
jgi:hypothetical protein